MKSVAPSRASLAERLLSGQADAQALLLYGQDLGEQSALANQIAKAWLCGKPTETGSCDVCAMCAAFESGRCVDFQRISPLPPSNWIRNGAIVPDPVGEPPPTIPLTEYFRTRPMMANRKVVIIEQADRLYPAAAHALLKTLEEPHDYCRLILTTGSVGSIMPTIRSRCLGVPCELGGLEPDDADAVLAFSEGQNSIKSRILACPETYGRLLDFCRKLPTTPPEAALRLSEEFRDIGDRLQEEAGLSSRNADLEILRALGHWTMAEHWPDAALAVAEAHRLTMGNGNFGLISDSLFVRLCAKR